MIAKDHSKRQDKWTESLAVSPHQTGPSMTQVNSQFVRGGDGPP